VPTKKEGHRLAPFGTKSFDSSNQAAANLDVAVPIPYNGYQYRLTQMPKPGDLIDVQGLDELWYQVFQTSFVIDFDH
jgi:hypothetical protein